MGRWFRNIWLIELIILPFFFSIPLLAKQIKLTTVEIKPPTACVVYVGGRIHLYVSTIMNHDYYLTQPDIWLREGFYALIPLAVSSPIIAMNQAGTSWVSWNGSGTKARFAIARDGETGPAQIWLAYFFSSTHPGFGECLLYVDQIDGQDFIIWTPDLVIGVRDRALIKIKLPDYASGFTSNGLTPYTSVIGISDPSTHSWNSHSVWVGVFDWDRVESEVHTCPIWNSYFVSHYYPEHPYPLVPISTLFPTGLPPELAGGSGIPTDAMWITQPYKEIRGTRRHLSCTCAGSYCTTFSPLSPSMSVNDVSSQSAVLDTEASNANNLFISSGGPTWFDRWKKLKRKVLKKLWGP